MKRVKQEQLVFVFAGRSQDGNSLKDIKEWLRHIANSRNSQSLTTKAKPHKHGLLEQVASLPNMAKALLNVAKNKGAAGVDGQSVDEVILKSRSLIPKLKHELLSGKYKPGEIRRVWIPKPDGGKRGLGIPNVIDRWIQQSVLQVMQPILEPRFHNSSHGFRPNRSTHTAIKQAKKYIEEGYRKVVDMDMSKFFDRVNHQRLLNRLGNYIKDQRLLHLVNQMLKAKVVLPDGTKTFVEEGTPQGGPLSPILANVVLDELDWELEKRGLRFVRYADDVNIYIRSLRAGKRVMDSIRKFIEGRLRLKVNEEKSQVKTPNKGSFLGFRFCLTRRGDVEIHPSDKSKKRIFSRIKKMTPRTWGQSIDSCMKALNIYLQSWEAYFDICNGRGLNLFRNVDAHIRRRLRMIIIKQKKRIRFLFRHLLKRGVDQKIAKMTAFSQKGFWKKSAMKGIHHAYPNSWFSDKLISLYDLWQKRHYVPDTVLDDQYLLAF